MEIKVQLNNIRIAPRKVRQAADVVRGKQVADAKALLDFTIKRAANPLAKLLQSAIATATHDFKLEEKNLYIQKLMVDEGPKLKRSFPMSRGRAYPIMKRTSHIVMILAEKTEGTSSKASSKKSTEKKSEEVSKKVATPKRKKTK